ncbi:Fur family transcriptional regulator [Alkaliphilus oremlandii]|uniref:Ferric uptake regulator, Fur family n=1 Tax=Alkaliphilus oremlandii (strain OhILAs) TaxID=350688 RepID=A8MM11_ALKOO|nr:Fur family transcriptional regulator [Alkaliphilus oremlandii]ABW18178.1 ferric uptake regulator, Fur family [Alkaliphilus oremlandii OhILAs]
MNETFEKLSEELKKKNIRLSHQRLKVLEYMSTHKTHPTVDQIYHDLHKDIPTLSKTTIYNTLNTLINAGLIKSVTIEDTEVRYDSVTDEHGHFKCESCGTIFDFSIDFNSFSTQDLGNFKIKNKDVYFKGICPNCISEQH